MMAPGCTSPVTTTAGPSYWPKKSSRTYMENVPGSSLYCLMMVQMNHMSYLQYDMSRRLNVFEFILKLLPETVLAYGAFDGSFELELIKYCSRDDDAPVSSSRLQYWF